MQSIIARTPTSKARHHFTFYTVWATHDFQRTEIFGSFSVFTGKLPKCGTQSMQWKVCTLENTQRAKRMRREPVKRKQADLVALKCDNDALPQALKRLTRKVDACNTQQLWALARGRRLTTALAQSERARKCTHRALLESYTQHIELFEMYALINESIRLCVSNNRCNSTPLNKSSSESGSDTRIIQIDQVKSIMPRTTSVNHVLELPTQLNASGAGGESPLEEVNRSCEVPKSHQGGVQTIAPLNKPKILPRVKCAVPLVFDRSLWVGSDVLVQSPFLTTTNAFEAVILRTGVCLTSTNAYLVCRGSV